MPMSSSEGEEILLISCGFWLPLALLDMPLAFVKPFCFD